MPTIVLADDHPVVRQGLRALLETEPDFVVVAEAEDGQQALDLTSQHKPNVLVTDLMMPGLNGLELARLVTRRNPSIRVIILSLYGDERYVRQALENGVTAFVLKDSKAEEIVKAIREVAAGRPYFCQRLSQLAHLLSMERPTERQLDSHETLTHREREVLHLAAEGLNRTQIGTRLKISPRTAESHRANLMRKLGLRTQSELVRYALRRGIIRLDHP